MIRKIMGTVLALGCVAVAATPAAAQFEPGYTDIGPVIGFGGIGSAGVSFGGRFEHAIKPLPSMGNGILSFSAGADFYSYDYYTTYGITYISLGATMNYHFKLEDSKFDPFLGLGLGYSIVNFDDVPGCPSCGDSYGSSVYFIGRAGARYFWKPNMSFYADLGAGAATIDLGLMFKIK